jgi:hypothetical protein
LFEFFGFQVVVHGLLIIDPFFPELGPLIVSPEVSGIPFPFLIKNVGQVFFPAPLAKVIGDVKCFGFGRFRSGVRFDVCAAFFAFESAADALEYLLYGKNLPLFFGSVFLFFLIRDFLIKRNDVGHCNTLFLDVSARDIPLDPERVNLLPVMGFPPVLPNRGEMAETAFSDPVFFYWVYFICVCPLFMVFLKP